jgi:hypothetical protein
MCEIVQIDPIIPRLMNSNSGGAQYLMKNVNWEYWEKVEKDSEQLFKDITKLNSIKKINNSSYHELQIWCADMWAVLWNGWLKENETKVIPEMNFSWATDSANGWDETTIYHNAGATCSCGGLFYKSLYMDSLPYSIEIEKFSKEKNCYNYVLEIKETAQKSCLI